VRDRLKAALRRLRLLATARRFRDGVRAARWAWRDIRPQTGPDGLPLPPLRLIMLVTGIPNIEWFLESGRLAALWIREILSRNGVDIEDLNNLLDFGCGCGRVVRQWKGLQTEIHGCDYNARLVHWCERTLPFASFKNNALIPPSPYTDSRFDFLYAISVFTHLPRELQRPWMEELARIVRPGGHLLVTTHGEHYLGMLADEERRAFERGELVIRDEDAAGSNVCGAYHPPQYVRDILAQGLELREFVPKGALGSPWQDVYLLRKP
jgi:SAM-dependent methyltransferase